MNLRKKCETCEKPLIAFCGNYLHPETPCSGLGDGIHFNAVVVDKQLYDKFVEMYGKPEMDDYDRLKALEDENTQLRINSESMALVLDFWLVRLILKLFRKN